MKGIEHLVIDSETAYPRLTPHHDMLEAEIAVAKYEYFHCRKCPLPECRDKSPLCPLPPVVGEKNKGDGLAQKGQGTAVPVVVLGVRYNSVAQACKMNGIKHNTVYWKAKKHGVAPQVVLQAMAGFARNMK